MSKQVIGVYESEEAVVTAVQQLQTKGYNTDDISVVTNHDRHHDSIEMRTGAEVDNLAELNRHEASLFDKLKHAFMDDDHRRDNTNLGERLTKLGIPESTASSYASDVESGKMLLVVDSDRVIHDRVGTNDPMDEAATAYRTETATKERFDHTNERTPNELGRDDYGNNLDVDRERPVDSRNNLDNDFQRNREDTLGARGTVRDNDIRDELQNNERSLRSDSDLASRDRGTNTVHTEETDEFGNKENRLRRNSDEDKLF